MKRLKLLQVFEVDGITPKRQTDRWSYTSLQGKLLRELKPIKVGSHMLLSPDDAYEPVRSTKVQAVDVDGHDMRVLTRNSIYHFELV
ncbi:hypothetical protein ACFFK0_17795 [Paenibacillus chartarius]|uniref:Uncharacterized protein n=1 Tax=Paenibacillus chartarius TaxID=747481 RepID=A0ABV6DNR4_9BACL